MTVTPETKKWRDGRVVPRVPITGADFGAHFCFLPARLLSFVTRTKKNYISIEL